jgi:uncharacterized double-CXXCG motif protein
LMKIFDVDPDDEGWGKQHIYDFNAAHKWRLPAVSCPVCGQTGGESMRAYPSVDLSSLPNDRPFHPTKPIPLKQWLPLRDQLRAIVNPGIRLLPGVSLGPITGTVRGDPGDIGWLNPWTPLVTVKTREALESYNLRFRAFPTDLKRRGKPDSTYQEIEFERHYARLHSSCFMDETPDCPTCGLRRRNVKAGPVAICSGSIPRDQDVFAVFEVHGYRLVTDRFREACLRLKLTNVKFKPFEVRDD